MWREREQVDSWRPPVASTFPTDFPCFFMVLSQRNSRVTPINVNCPMAKEALLSQKDACTELALPLKQKRKGLWPRTLEHLHTEEYATCGNLRYSRNGIGISYPEHYLCLWPNLGVVVWLKVTSFTTTTVISALDHMQPGSNSVVLCDSLTTVASFLLLGPLHRNNSDLC